MEINYWQNIHWRLCFNDGSGNGATRTGQLPAWHSANSCVCIQEYRAPGFRMLHFRFQFPTAHFIRIACSSPTERMLLLLLNTTRPHAQRPEYLSGNNSDVDWFLRSDKGEIAVVVFGQDSGFDLAPPLPVCPATQQWIQQLVDSPPIKKPAPSDWSPFLQKLSSEASFPTSLPILRWQSVLTVARTLYKRNQNLFSPLELVQLSGMSSTYLKTYFSAAFQQTLHSFQQQYRMQRACRLLFHSDSKLDEIAQTCGYAEASNFIPAFVRHFGSSPAACFR